MTAPHTQSQPKVEPVRRDPPVCCDCDAILCCAACGMEQPYTDISILRAKVDELRGLGLFLVNRLDEFDPGDFDAERDFHGHVAPALARFRGALAVNSQDRGTT